MSEEHHERFARFFAEGSMGLRQKIARLVGNRADTDDIMQEAFLRGLEHAETVRIPAAFLYSAARNIAFDMRRRHKSASRLLLDGVTVANFATQFESLESQLESEERGLLLTQATERLPTQCRTVFALKLNHGYSHQEVAHALGISIKTVEYHITRGIREIQQHVSRDSVRPLGNRQVGARLGVFGSKRRSRK